MPPLGRLLTLTAFAASAIFAPAEGATFDTSSQHWMTITTCNDFRATVFVAFAYPEDGVWTSRGWLRVRPESCKNAKLPATEFSFHAETDWYPNGRHNSRNEWGGSRRFCVSDGSVAFAFHPAGRCDGGRQAKFSATLGSDRNLRLTISKDGRSTLITFL